MEIKNVMRLEQLLNMMDDIIEDEYESPSLDDDVFRHIMEERDALEELIEKIDR